jgi:hypothetical protein
MTDVEERVTRLRRSRSIRIDPAFGWRMLNTDSLLELQRIRQIGRVRITMSQRS